MKVSIQQVANLLAGRNDCLAKAIFAVIGQGAENPDRGLEQSEADAIADHIDAQHQASSPDLFAEVAEMVGESAVEMSASARRECNAAAQAAIEIFRISGLRTPASWAE